MESNEITEFVFNHPFTCMIAGPSGSGKTTLLKKILINLNELINVNIDRIVYCYSRWQSTFDELKRIIPNIEFNNGLPDIEDFNKEKNNLLILDDLMKECGKDSSIVDVFTVDSHHKNIGVFFLSQNLFPNHKNSRTISLNCHYIINLNNPRDRAQFKYFARQMFPDNSQYLLECFNDAVETKPYGYLFLDCTQTTNSKFRVQTAILPTDQRIIYQEKN